MSIAKNYEDKLRITKEIIQNFIEKDSKNEIPISEEERNNIFDNFKTLIAATTTTTSSSIISDTTIVDSSTAENSEEIDTTGSSSTSVEDPFDEIFDIVKELQYTEMYRDILPRYIRSKNCMTMMLKYLDDTEVIKSKKSAQFPYQNSDFKRQYLKKMDFDFMKSLTKDDLNWELSKKFFDWIKFLKKFYQKVESVEGELNIFFSDINVINNVTCISDPNFIKYDIVLPYTFDYVVSKRKRERKSFF